MFFMYVDTFKNHPNIVDIADQIMLTYRLLSSLWFWHVIKSNASNLYHSIESHWWISLEMK